MATQQCGFGYGTLTASLINTAMSDLLEALQEDGYTDERQLRSLIRTELMSFATGAFDQVIDYVIDEWWEKRA